MSTSACVSPVSGFTWSAASVSGTDAEAMSGGLAFAGFEGAGSASDLFGVVRIVTTFLCKILHPEAEEEFIDLAKVVYWLLQEPSRDLFAQCPMRAVVPE